MKIIDLIADVDDYMVHKFFDSDSEKMLDEKIEVLEALKRGEKPMDIKNYYKVLELYPTDQHWD
jgi:hypothetical protein